MKDDLIEIKNKIIDKLITINQLIVIAIVVSFVYKLLTEGWGKLYWFTIAIICFLLSIFLFRKKIAFTIKLLIYSLVFLVLGIIVLYHYNFSSVFYLSFIPILINGILMGRKSAIIYFAIVAVSYFTIAYGYITGYIGKDFDYIHQIKDPFTWVVFFLATMFFLALILISTSELYSYFIITINSKNELAKELEKHNEKLEFLVKERTDELEATNEELQAINNELNEKNIKFEEKNLELTTTLKQLKDTQANLVQSEKMASLGILTAGVAHEINNPLNYIMGAYVGLERINNEKSYEDNKDTILVLLESLKIGVGRASSIVTGLNQFSRDTKSLNEDCNLHQIIENCIVMLHHQIKQRIVINSLFYSSDIVIKGNVGNLHQVFLNIIGNAIDAIPAEGEIMIKTILANQKVQIAIIDNGEGISQENLKKIIDPFFTTKDPDKGTGLGLYISYNIIKNHKGTLDFQSEKGKGTTVTIKLPIN